MVRDKKMTLLKISITKLEKRNNIISSQYYGPQLLITPGPGDPIPSSEFHGHKACSWFIYIYAGKMYS